MISASTDELLKGIGCNMTTKTLKGVYPEECLTYLSKIAIQDFKTLTLMNTALQKHKGLFHPEILLKYLYKKNVDLNVIGALLNKTRDRRYLKVISFCKNHAQPSEIPKQILSLSARIGQSKFDQDFKKFGIELSELPLGDERKIMSTQRLIRNNTVFKNRVLFGCNWRADIISCIEFGFANPSQIKKRLNCSYETAHRVFNDYVLYKTAAA